jgi:queuine tRNA-ribosyltransferase/7-cyano-7-deazaguanine tRNA-ribosyltransferase
MTDSGGFQVFSLGFGRDQKVGKILSQGEAKSSRVVEEGDAPQNLKITMDGVEFRDPENGDKLFLGPTESIRIQESLGADISFAFDECTSPLANRVYTAASLERTHSWARMCLEARRTKQALFGIVQGGRYKDLRLQSAREIGRLPFDGFGIGGEFGSSRATMNRMLRWVLGVLPEDKPRHLLGIGKLEDIPLIIRAGIDLFDCTVPTHFARHGAAFTSHGQLDLSKIRFLKERRPLDERCICSVCATYDRQYISHLIRSREITGLKLLTVHNLTFFNHVVAKIREGIKRGKL